MLLPTMTLDEIYNAVYGDWSFIVEKTDLAVKDFRRKGIKQHTFPFKRKYSYKNYNDNIVYTFYMTAFKRSQWENPLMAITTSYTHEQGTTVIIVDYSNNKELLLLDTHFWARFRERYIQDSSKTTQEVIDFFLFNFNTMGRVEEVMRVNEELSDPDSEYFAVVSPMGVCYCERLNDNKKVIVFRTYLSMEMLRKEQNRKVAAQYVCTYFKDYINYNPKETAKIDAIMEEFMSTADKEEWPMDKFITESEKLMDKYPLYVL